jgi:hypothetical protein
LKDGGITATAASPIIEDICIHALSFTKVDYAFCPRNSNFVAHVLAKDCDAQPNVWFEDPPPFIISRLIDDVVVI